MTYLRLNRHSSASPAHVPHVRLVGDLSFALSRVHEICGPARRSLVAMLAAERKGPVIWISPSWGESRLCGYGLADWMDPGRLLHVQPDRPADLLWSMEEVLRSGVGEGAVVVADMPKAPNMTSVRRLHLAAEAGAKVSGGALLPLLLTPEEGGAPGIETRWYVRTAPTPDSGSQGNRAHSGPRQDGRQWVLERRRARMAPPRSWQVTRDICGALHAAPLGAQEEASPVMLQSPSVALGPYRGEAVARAHSF